MTTSALIMKQHLFQKVCLPRPASAPPSKPLLSSESEGEGDNTAVGGVGEGEGEEERSLDLSSSSSSAAAADSVSETATETSNSSNNKKKKKTQLLKTPPETPPSVTKTTPAKVPASNNSNTNNTNKSRNNKRKTGSKKQQQHEFSRSGHHSQGSATTTTFSANMQAAGLLIVDGSSRPKNVRNGTAGDNFQVENPYAAEDSQAAVPKPEPAPKETPRRNRKPYVSPNHGTNPQYGSYHDMPMYMSGVQEGYYFNEPPLRPEYPATYVQHPHAYQGLPPQQGFPPPPPPVPYQPRFDQMRYEQQQQRPIPYRGGYGGYQRYHNNHYHHRHSHHHQGMGDYHDDGQYYANYGYSGYTPPRSYYHNATWNRSRQVSAEEERVLRRSPPYPPISPPRTVTAAVEDAAGFESVAPVVPPVVQDEGEADLEVKSTEQAVVDTVAEQVETKPELAAIPAKIDAKLEAIVELDVKQLDAKPELSSTAEESTVSREKLDTVEKSTAEKTEKTEKPEEPPVSSDSGATFKMDTARTPVESDINTEVVAEPSNVTNVSLETITEQPVTTETPATLAPEELAVIHDSETETLQASPRAVSPEDLSHQIIQHQDSLIVHFAAVELVQLLPLSSHLVSVFTKRTYSDVEIALSSPDNNWISGKFPAHRVIVAQSTVLDSILKRREAIDGKLRMELIAGKRFSMLRSFDCALQNLYGLPLLEFDDIAKHTRIALSWGGVQTDHVPAHITALELDFLIGYMVAGAFMNIERIAINSFRIMEDYTHWCNLETAFHFGLYPEDFLIMYVEMDEEPLGKKGGKGNKGKGRKKPGELPPMAEPLNGAIIGNFAPRIATLAAKWLVENMPTNFAFDRTAYTTRCLKDRIPSKLLTGTRSSSSPAPTATELAVLEAGRRAQPSVAHRLISGILLALPFALLHETADLLRREGMLTAKLVREVLQEREQRRAHALREYVNKQPNKKVRDVPASHVVLGYREFAVHFETRDMMDEHMQEIKHDFTLHREWVGYQTGGEAEPVLEKFRD